MIRSKLRRLALCGLVLGVSGVARAQESTSESADIETVLAEFEHAATRTTDPSDGLEKAHVVNREGGIRVWVDDDGLVTLAAREDSDASVFFEVAGRDAASVSVASGTIDVVDTNIQQLWTNTVGGVEHAMIVEEAFFSDEERAEGDVSVDVYTAGLRPQVLSDTSVLFREDGRTALSYRSLHAFDANLTTLPAWFDADGSTLSVHVVVDEATAWPITIDPLAQSASPSFSVGASDTWFGFALTAADVDADGYDDLLVGAPDYSGGNNDEGRIYLIYGSSSGLDTANPATFEPNVTSAQCGETVAIGNVIGDSRLDLIAGCPGESSNDGRLRVYEQTASRTFASATVLSDNSASGSSLGRENTLTVANLDGSGISEVVSAHPGLIAVWNLTAGTTPDTTLTGGSAGQIVRFPVPTTGATREGVAVAFTDTVTVYIGQASGYISASAGESFSLSVETGVVAGRIAAGDVNADGVTDVLVGVPGTIGGGSAGGASLYPNGGSESFGSVLWSVSGSGSEEMGSGVLSGC